jgi:gallate dioxygenase
MWLVMRGALSAGVRCAHRSYYLPSMTAIATAIYENESAGMGVDDAANHLDRMGEQLRGAEAIGGTYPYTLDRSNRGYRLNKFLHELIRPEFRARFLADEEACFTEAGLSEEERDLVRRRDWRGLIHYGIIFFLLEKLGAAIGVSNLHIYAAMSEQSLDDFQKTRNQQVLYSVAGQTSN